MKNFKAILIVAIFFVAGFFLGQSWQTPTKISAPTNTENAKSEDAQQILVSFEFSEDKISFYPLDWSQNLTVLEASRKSSENNSLAFKTQDYGDLGVLVTEIGDKVNGQDNKYWQYWVNKKQPQVGANDYILNPQDLVEWKFAESIY